MHIRNPATFNAVHPYIFLQWTSKDLLHEVNNELNLADAMTVHRRLMFSLNELCNTAAQAFYLTGLGRISLTG